MGTIGRAAYTIGSIVAGAAGAGLAAASAAHRLDRRRMPSGTSTRTAAPLREQRIPAHDGGLLRVLESGPPDGRPVVLLHGVTLRAELWTHQLADLCDAYRVVAPDWRGHGASTCGSDGYGLSVLARDLATILDHLDLGETVVVGHSMGGMALMRFCRDHPDVLRRRISGLVFVSTAGCRVGAGAIGTLFRLVNRFAQHRPAIVDRVPVSAPGDVGYALTRLGFGRRPSADEVERTREMTAAMEPSAAGRSLAALIDHDETPTLRTLDVPVLVLVGTNDLLTPEWQAREIAAAVPHCAIEAFEGAGHLLMLERRERFDAALREFAERVHRGSMPAAPGTARG